MHRYVIQVGNWTRKPQRVDVLENIPVSQNNDIKVKLARDATRPTRHDRDDGMLTWRLKLRPRSKKRIVLHYTVELPKDYVVRGYDQPTK